MPALDGLRAVGGWSVSCEASFYVALPLALALIRGRIWRSLVLVVITMTVAQWFARAVVFANGGFNNAASFNPVEHAPVFAVGIAAALVASRWNRDVPPSWLGVVPLGLAVLVLPVSTIPGYHLMPHLAFALLVSICVAMATLSPPLVLANAVIARSAK